MLTKFCTVCSHMSLGIGHTGFLVWCCKLHATFLHTSYYSFAWHFVCSSFCNFVGVLVAMQKMHAKIECVFNQPSTLGAQVRFVLNLRRNTRWFLSGKKKNFIPDYKASLRLSKKKEKKGASLRLFLGSTVCILFEPCRDWCNLFPQIKARRACLDHI